MVAMSTLSSITLLTLHSNFIPSIITFCLSVASPYRLENFLFNYPVLQSATWFNHWKTGRPLNYMLSWLRLTCITDVHDRSLTNWKEVAKLVTGYNAHLLIVQQFVDSRPSSTFWTLMQLFAVHIKIEIWARLLEDWCQLTKSRQLKFIHISKWFSNSHLQYLWKLCFSFISKLYILPVPVIPSLFLFSLREWGRV